MKYAIPLLVMFVVDASASVVFPTTFNVPVKIPFPIVAPVALKLVVDALASVAVPVMLSVVPVREEMKALVNVRPDPEIFVVEALSAVKFVVEAITDANKVVVPLVEITSVNVFIPANDCDVVDTNPRAAVPASGIANV